MIDTPRPLVLAVDDDPRNLVALEAILDGTGYRVATTTSGSEALEIALRESPAVVLLDVVMPDMDGYEVAKHLKGVDRTRDIPIIFLTAVATDIQYIYRAYEAGAIDYLIKPLDPHVVRRKVAVLVDLAVQREQIKRQAEALREADLREHELRIAELRVASDRRYQKLVEGIDHAIGWTMDENLRFTFLSRRAPLILGYSVTELSEPGFWARHVPPVDAETLLGIFRNALSEGCELACNHRLIHADGRTLWFHTGVSGERGVGGGQLAELHGISVDVTDIKRAQEEAQRAMHVREELIAIVAHDLRNPLNSISSSAGLLQSVAERAVDPRVQSGAQAIRRAVDHMDRIIGDLLDFALIQAERVTITPRPLEVDDVIGQTVAMFEPMAATRDLRLEQRVGEALRIHADRDRVLQILSNLVGNAIKFTPEGGTVTIGAERTGDGVRFAITDTGPGMSESDAERMWERYWQAQKTRSPARGLGLGLSIAQGLVEAHGGRIWARSELGRGTTLYFTMPLAAPAGDSARPSA